jgi:HEAT repeat protein
MLEALAGAADAEVKAFFIRQVQLVGSDASAGALGRLLADGRLCEPATQALLRIRTPTCAAQLRRALPQAKGGNLATIVQALGVLRDGPSVRAILPHASAVDTTLRHTAWYALANIGDASAAGVLAKAAASKGAYERSTGTKYYLLLAGRLAEQGHKDACAAICRELYRARGEDADDNVRSAALRVLADALGTEAADDLLAAAGGKSLDLREAALAILAKLPGESVTRKLLAHAKAASGEAKGAAVAALGRRGDVEALPAVLSAVDDSDPAVYAAAMTALARLSPPEALKALTAGMKSTDAGRIAAAKETLAWVRAEGFGAAAARAYPGASAPGKAALLELLAARGATNQAKLVLGALDDADPQVRQAATRALGAVAGADELPTVIRRMLSAESARERQAAQAVVVSLCRSTGKGAEPVLAFLARADGAQRAVLLGTLARIGGPAALKAVLSDIEKDSGGYKDAAVRALADWQDAEAAPHLLTIARRTDNAVHRVLTLRACVRLLSLPGGRPAAQTVEMYRQALDAADKPAEKKMVLAGLGKVRSLEALKLVGRCLDDRALAEEAAAAAVNIACPAKGREKPLRGPVVTEVLQKVVKVSRNQDVVRKAAAHLGT